MKVAFISATPNSLKPIELAFAIHAPEIRYFHLLDSDLLNQLENAGEITYEIINRFVDLIRLAEKSNADLIQFTCSAFNDITKIIAPLSSIPILRSDEAVLNKALAFKKVGLISTVKETPVALKNYLYANNPDIEVLSEVEDGAIHLLSVNKKEEHDQKVIQLIKKIENEVDVLILSQYSLEHIKDLYISKTPILSAATETAINVKSHYEKNLN